MQLPMAIRMMAIAVMLTLQGAVRCMLNKPGRHFRNHSGVLRSGGRAISAVQAIG